jgi:hypothetical protein
MSFEAVWGALPEVGWVAAERIRESIGLEEDQFNQVLNFLVRWEFVETRRDPEFSIKRKAGALSPVDVVGALRNFGDVESGIAPSPGRVRLAERVACRICGGRTFSFVEQNLVECRQCHEQQWYAIEAWEVRKIRELLSVRLGGLRRLLKGVGA